jgi:type 1 glutamine amidotransferase
MQLATPSWLLIPVFFVAMVRYSLAAEPRLKEAADLQKIEKAIPPAALARPKKARKLLIFDLNVNYGGHASIPYANTAFTLMGQKTGAFQTVVSRDPEVFRPASLRQFDAVFLNNNVGNLFTDAQLRQSLIDFVYSGGGLMAVHGTTVAFTRWPGAIEDWPEFGVMLGGRGANHKKNDELVVAKFDDPMHPLNAPFAGRSFEYHDEFFRVHGSYSRERVRVLFSIDTARTDMTQTPSYGAVTRPDNDYALAWVRNYGRGRVFYCTIAHNPYVFYDPQMLRFYLGAAQFVLGDLDAPTTPSAKLTPAVLAQERLGWRPGFVAPARQTLFDSIDSAANRGLSYMGAVASSDVSEAIARPFAPGLSDDDLRQIRLKLDSASVRLLTYSLVRLPGREEDCRPIFAFARKMGIEAIIATASSDSLNTLEKLSDEFDIHLALTIPDPNAAVALLRARSPRIGLCVNVPQWQALKIDPAGAGGFLWNRLIVAYAISGDGNEFLATIHRLGLKPLMLGVSSAKDFFNQTCVNLAK